VPMSLRGAIPPAEALQTPCSYGYGGSTL
jgi:hypothetical protein